MEILKQLYFLNLWYVWMSLFFLCVHSSSDDLSYEETKRAVHLLLKMLSDGKIEDTRHSEYLNKKSTESSCPENFTLLNNRCYRIEGKKCPLEEARARCAGLGAELVAIEDEEELAIIRSWLKGEIPDSHPRGGSAFWTDAQCRQPWTDNESTQCPGGFSWKSGEKVLETLWMPDRGSGASPRPWLKHKQYAPDGVVLWREADFMLENRPSVWKMGIPLCELPLEVDCGGETTMLDLLFVVDSSGSIAPQVQSEEEIRASFESDPDFDVFRETQPDTYNSIVDAAVAASRAMSGNWLTLLEFVKDIVQSLTIGPDDVRVGMITFSDRVVKQFEFNDFSTKADVVAAIDKTAYLGQSTRTSLALDSARTEIIRKGDRSGSEYVVLVITDGQSNGEDGQSDTEATIQSAVNLHDLGIKVISVGVSSSIDLREVQQISSPPHLEKSDWFTVDGFENLVDKLEDIVKATENLCPVPPTDCVGSECTTCPANHVLSKFNKCEPSCVDYGRDVFFLLDSSDSVRDLNPADGSYDNFNLELEFIADVIDGLDNLGPGPNQVRINVLSFGSTLYPEIYGGVNRYNMANLLDPTLYSITKDQLKDAVMNIEYHGGRTFTAGAFQLVDEILEAQIEQYPARSSEVPKIIVLLTDGPPTKQSGYLVPLADSLKDVFDVRVLVVGVTKNVQNDAIANNYLAQTASQPLEENYWYIDDFPALNGVVQAISETICP